LALALGFVEFTVDDVARFERLRGVFELLKSDKAAGEFREGTEYRRLFTEAELSRFWWPTPTELEDWKRRWFATPVESRFSDPALETPWTFKSLLYAFENGEYSLAACRMTEARRARLEFEIEAFPFGGTACMEGLIEAFGFTVLGVDDGTGYKPN
jgi:hypothetical protein